jgi:hypothetical protein
VKERSRINDNFLTVVALLSQMSTHASGAPGVLEVHLHEPPDDVLPFNLFIHQATSHGNSLGCRSLIDPALGACQDNLSNRHRELWGGDRSMVCQVFSTGCGRERLAEGFFVGLRDASVGYVIVVPRTLAKGVRV